MGQQGFYMQHIFLFWKLYLAIFLLEIHSEPSLQSVEGPLEVSAKIKNTHKPYVQHF